MVSAPGAGTNSRRRVAISQRTTSAYSTPVHFLARQADAAPWTDRLLQTWPCQPTRLIVTAGDFSLVPRGPGWPSCRTPRFGPAEPVGPFHLTEGVADRFQQRHPHGRTGLCGPKPHLGAGFNIRMDCGRNGLNDLIRAAFTASRRRRRIPPRLDSAATVLMQRGGDAS